MSYVGVSKMNGTQDLIYVPINLKTPNLRVIWWRVDVFFIVVGTWYDCKQRIIIVAPVFKYPVKRNNTLDQLLKVTYPVIVKVYVYETKKLKQLIKPVFWLILDCKLQVTIRDPNIPIYSSWGIVILQIVVLLLWFNEN